MQSLSVSEVERFMKAAAADRWHPIFAMALATGMRPEEYLALQWKDIDLEKGTAVVAAKSKNRHARPRISKSVMQG